MGVKNLSKILKKFCPQIIKRTKLEQYKGKKIGIDASIFFYKFIYVSNKYNKPNYYLHLFFQQMMNMISMNIMPIYIFDGEAPKAKDNEQEKRKKTRDESRHKLREQKELVLNMKNSLQQLKTFNFKNSPKRVQAKAIAKLFARSPKSECSSMYEGGDKSQ